MNIPSLLSLNYPTHVAATQASRGHTVTKRKHSKYEASESNPFLLQDFKIRFQKVRGLSCVCVCGNEGSVFIVTRWVMCVTKSVHFRGPSSCGGLCTYTQNCLALNLCLAFLTAGLQTVLLWSNCAAVENGASNSQSHLPTPLLGFEASCGSAKIEIGTGSKHEMGSWDLPPDIHTHTPSTHASTRSMWIWRSPDYQGWSVQTKGGRDKLSFTECPKETWSFVAVIQYLLKSLHTRH